MAELLVVLARICLMVAIILNFVTMLKDFSRSHITHTHSTHTQPSKSVPEEERTSGLYGARED